MVNMTGCLGPTCKYCVHIAMPEYSLGEEWDNGHFVVCLILWILIYTLGHSEWIITVGHRPNSEPNLPRAEQFNERAATVAGLPASVIKGVVKNAGVAIIATWQLCIRAIAKLETWLRNGKHKFKQFFRGWQEEKMTCFSRYFQAVANWIWKGVSVTVVALLYDSSLA